MSCLAATDKSGDDGRSLIRENQDFIRIANRGIPKGSSSRNPFSYFNTPKQEKRPKANKSASLHRRYHFIMIFILCHLIRSSMAAFSWRRPQTGRQWSANQPQSYLNCGRSSRIYSSSIILRSSHYHLVRLAIDPSTTCALHHCYEYSKGLAQFFHIMRTPSSEAGLDQAQQVCTSCKTRKRKCDKALPACSSCTK